MHDFTLAKAAFTKERIMYRLPMTNYPMMGMVNLNCGMSDFRPVLNEQFQIRQFRMPWNDKLLGFRFRDIGRDLEAEAEVIIKEHHVTPLQPDIMEGERNRNLVSLPKSTMPLRG